jgi:hypothetical protein
VLGATVSALGDALYNAPLVQTGDMLSTPPLPTGQLSPSRARTYFFVFDYQTKIEDHSQVCRLTINFICCKIFILRLLFHAT